jgi:hypothetical protein
MTALYFLRNTEKAVIIATSNRYLTIRSYRLFRELFREMKDVPVTIDVTGGRVSFLTPESLASIDNKDDHVLIMDEVDQECFDPVNRKNKSFCFNPSLHKEFHALIGFSGSIGGAEEWDAFSSLYEDPCLLRVPRLQNSQTPTRLHDETIEDKRA